MGGGVAVTQEVVEVLSFLDVEVKRGLPRRGTAGGQTDQQGNGQNR